ncbi:MAG: cation-translocating P-type ATPase [Simkania negevensis]|nr:cation-translocating P-type ATPase [Simkania negevensis]
MKELHLYIQGLDCAEEAKLLRGVFRDKEGIEDPLFDLLRSKMSLFYDPAEITPHQLIELVARAGMKARFWEEREQSQTFFERKGTFLFTILSGLFLLFGILFHFLISLDWRVFFAGEESFSSPPLLALFFYLISIVFGVYFVLPKVLLSAKTLHPDMHLLIFLAVIGAAVIGQWFEDHLLVHPGERISFDGVVVKGSSSVDQSPITGESLPALKKKGDFLYAGTLNQEGALEFQVAKKGEESTLAQMRQLVEEGQKKKAKVEELIEKFAGIYTPCMIGISLFLLFVLPFFFSFSWGSSFYRSLAFLIIACPCALVISTPVTLAAAIASSARHGVIIKGGRFLEIMGKLKALALDKTGTLTYGHPVVQKIIPLSGHTEEELLERAAALEAASEHPIARAILKEAKRREICPERAEEFSVIRGKGAEGIYLGKRYWIGSHLFLHEMKQETEEIHQLALSLEDAGHSMIAIGNDNHVCGLLSVADRPREKIKEVIKELKKLGIEEIVMLTGDNTPSAQAIASLAGIKHVQAELLPEKKMESIEKLRQKWKTVAMIGDGINDAPAMAAACCGIAMGAMGTEVAIKAADIALMGDDLSQVPWLISHGRRALKVIKQNISFSLSVKFLVFTLTLLGFSSLWMAIAADTGASLLVILNGLRLLKKS